jgi:phage pi2 protein 07
MIEDAQAIDYDYIKNDGYVYYPKSKNEISFEIKSVQWAASKPEVAPEDE